MKALVRRLRRSLAAPLILLADLERQEMLLGSIQAQGRLVAAAVEPQLERASPDTFTDAAETLSHFSDGNARIRLLFRPGKAAGAGGFYLVGAAPAIPAGGLDRERQQLIGQGVLDDVAESCSVRFTFRPLASTSIS